MPSLIRTLRLLSIVIWVGGIIFFAFAVAPVAFHTLPSRHLAGLVVGGLLRVLDTAGIVCGLVFLLATTWLLRSTSAGINKSLRSQMVFVSLMVLGTVYIQIGILPQMEIDRIAVGGDITSAPESRGPKLHFEKLHRRSERVEGAVLFLGVAIIFLMAQESRMVDRINS